MKLYFICLIGIIVLFSNCSRNALLIKKRYSRGFYLNHATSVKAKEVIFSPEKELANIDAQNFTPGTKENSFSANGFNGIQPTPIRVQSNKPLTTLLQKRATSNSGFKKHSFQNSPMYYNGSRVSDTVAASAGMLAALVTILALVKTFGLIFTLPVCFVIAFTAVAIFFMMRNHVKD